MTTAIGYGNADLNVVIPLYVFFGKNWAIDNKTEDKYLLQTP
jgi:hypothetical protein